MTRFSTPVLAACGTLLLLGCAAPRSALDMQPLLRLQHGGDQAAAAWYRLGKYHQERGETSLALGAYAQSLALDGRQLDARMAVAAIDARQGRLAEARDALQALVAEYPAQAQLSNNLGYVYHLMGDQQAAIAMLRRALALDTASAKAQDNLRLAEAAAQRGADSATLAAAAPAPAPAQSLPAQLAAAATPVTAPAPIAAPPTLAAAMPGTPAPLPAAIPGTPAALPAAIPGAPTTPATSMQAAAATPATALPGTAAIAATSATSAAPAREAAVAVAGPAQADADAGLPPPTRAELRALQEQLRRLELRSAAAQAAPSAPPAAEPHAPLETVAASTAAQVRVRVDITNGNGVQGLAKRWRSTLAQAGIPVGQLSNNAPYRQQTTTIEYRPGLRDEASALQKSLQGNVALQEAGPHASAKLRLVLGKDMRSEPALAATAPGGRMLAANTDQ